MFKKYLLLIYFLLIGYLSLSHMRGFGNDKFLKKILLDFSIDEQKTLFIINKNMWPSSYYFTKTFGKDIKLCLNAESMKINSKEKANKIATLNKNGTNIFCKNLGLIDYEKYNLILYLYPSYRKFEKEFINYELIKNYEFNVRYGIIHNLISGNLNYFKKINNIFSKSLN